MAVYSPLMAEIAPRTPTVAPRPNPLAEEILLDPGEVTELMILPRHSAQTPSPDASAGNIPTILRHSHHQMARLIAIGTKVNEVALITGYTPGYISSLKHDPTFAELIEHYREKQDEIFVDAIQRLKELGLVAAEEILERLSTNPKEWGRKDLLEVVQLAFGKGAGLGLDGVRAGGKGVPPVSIEVTFVQPPEMRGPGESASRHLPEPGANRQYSPVIEGTSREIE